MILVTGATGRVGRELVALLVSAEVSFRALVRDPARAGGLPAVIGDLDKPLDLDGFSQVFLLTPGTGTSQCANVVDAGQIPQALADAMTEAFELVRADTVGLRTDTVRQLLGRPPRSFADWSERHRAAFTG
jgi:nucleoside-diphosphate-sugar epimerase